MEKKMGPQELELYRAVDEVLQYTWDPIGVSSIPQARGEYHGYLPQVYGLLGGGADENAIAAYLTKVTTEQMGLSEKPSHDLEVAKILIDWKNFIVEKFA